MRHTAWWPLLTLLAACTGTDNTDGDPTDTDATPVDGPPTFESLIKLEEDLPEAFAYAADFSCVPEGTDWASTPWLTQTPLAELPGNMTIDGTVKDFDREDEVVADATVSLWYDDHAVEAPDDIAVSDDDGLMTIDGPSCQPMTYKVNTDPGRNETRDTYKAHQIWATPAGGSIDAEFISVSNATYQVIPSILGQEVIPGMAIIAGTAADCTRAVDASKDDDSGKIEGVQVVVYDDAGNIPEDLVVKYFVDDFPDRKQKYTSADGLWVAVNVPPGPLRVEMWAWVDGEYKILGATRLISYADSINIANIFAGYGEGVKYPDACLPL